MKIRILKANKRHLERINEIMKISFPDKKQEIGIKDKYSYPIVAKIGRKIVGFGIGSYLWGDKLHILDIAVDPEYRGMGIGKLIMEHLIFYAKKCKMKECYLEVEASNIPAIKLYQKLGFKIKAGYKFPWLDDIIYNMTLELNEPQDK